MSVVDVNIGDTVSVKSYTNLFGWKNLLEDSAMGKLKFKVLGVDPVFVTDKFGEEVKGFAELDLMCLKTGEMLEIPVPTTHIKLLERSK